jgi:curved DNA-binding protein CbpA
MKTPYEILEISTLADDGEIKQAYLQKVKQFPPDHHHEMFQQIQTAYQAIKDQKSRIAYDLFHFPQADFDALLDYGLTGAESVKINYDAFDKLLKASMDDRIFHFGSPSS